MVFGYIKFHMKGLFLVGLQLAYLKPRDQCVQHEKAFSFLKTAVSNLKPERRYQGKKQFDRIHNQQTHTHTHTPRRR